MSKIKPGDSQERIEQCLNCRLPRCVNCFGLSSENGAAATAERNERILSEYARGVLPQIIAEELGITEGTVRQILVKNGVYKYRRSRTDRSGEALQMRRSGMTTDEIAAKMGLSRCSVLRYVSKAKIREEKG